MKAFACMECYKCVKKHCPKGLNPLLINEIIKWQYSLKGHAPITYTDTKDQYAKQRVLASIQVVAEDYKRIFMPTNKKSARFVFFPGCNVYIQPEKVLEALDIMDIIGEDYGKAHLKTQLKVTCDAGFEIWSKLCSKSNKTTRVYRNIFEGFW